MLVNAARPKFMGTGENELSTDSLNMKFGLIYCKRSGSGPYTIFMIP